MKKLVLVCLGILLPMAAAISAESGLPPTRGIEVLWTAEQKQDAGLDTMMRKLVKACPGLHDYGNDFSAAVVKPFSGFYGDDGLVIEFQVVAQPMYLPAPLKKLSASDKCLIDINGARSQASIAKNTCASLCTGTWTDRRDNLLLTL